MLKYKIKKGFSLIEVMCSFSVFSIFFILIVLIEINNIKLSRSNANLDYYCRYIESLKNEISMNCNYNQIKELALDQKIYITKTKMDIDTLKLSNIEDLISIIVPNEMTYTQINIYQGNVMKIQVLLHYLDLDKQKVIKCEFYKGNYY